MKVVGKSPSFFLTKMMLRNVPILFSVIIAERGSPPRSSADLLFMDGTIGGGGEGQKGNAEGVWRQEPTHAGGLRNFPRPDYRWDDIDSVPSNLERVSSVGTEAGWWWWVHLRRRRVFDGCEGLSSDLHPRWKRQHQVMRHRRLQHPVKKSTIRRQKKPTKKSTKTKKSRQKKVDKDKYLLLRLCNCPFIFFFLRQSVCPDFMHSRGAEPMPSSQGPVRTRRLVPRNDGILRGRHRKCCTLPR